MARNTIAVVLLIAVMATSVMALPVQTQDQHILNLKKCYEDLSKIPGCIDDVIKSIVQSFLNQYEFKIRPACCELAIDVTEDCWRTILYPSYNPKYVAAVKKICAAHAKPLLH
ncbi:hypothetical protein QJS10_CPA05g02216 [Acorus calamus]|uniref:Prolamin-like domain-containing protein n=1 Tax=Acorus calamus TaxID=4465 RepID=A0AAV9EVX8_ACOCL|nr:hypothetical protein QJS10_CPA05g02216 [Acorus calamus]